MFVFFFSSRRRHTRYWRDWSSDVCSSDPPPFGPASDPELVIVQIARRVYGDCANRIACGSKLDKVPRDRRSEERRVGKEGRSRWSPDHLKKNTFTYVHQLILLSFSIRQTT